MAINLPYYVSPGDIYSQIMGQGQAAPRTMADYYPGFTGGYDTGLYQRLRDEAAARAAAQGAAVPGLLDGGGGPGEMEANQAAQEAFANSMAAVAADQAAAAADMNAAAQAAADAAAAAGGAAAGAAAGEGLGYGGGGYGGEGEGSGGFYAKGGKVMMRGLLVDEMLPGPDDGYAALQAGEYVIKKSTTKKLGDKKLQALNEGRASIKMRKE